MDDEFDLPVDTKTVAAWICVTPARIYEHVAAGVITRRPDGKFVLKTAVGQYCRHISRAASGRKTETSDEAIKLIRARTQVAVESARRLRLENDLECGRVAAVEDIVQIFSEKLLVVRSAFLALPTEIAPSVLKLRTAPEVQAFIYDAITGCMEDLTAGDMQREMFSRFPQLAGRGQLDARGLGDPNNPYNL